MQKIVLNSTLRRVRWRAGTPPRVADVTSFIRWKIGFENRRGEVSFDRRRDISRRIIQGLAIAGI
jgi:hypothetical protein